MEGGRILTPRLLCQQHTRPLSQEAQELGSKGRDICVIQENPADHNLSKGSLRVCISDRKRYLLSPRRGFTTSDVREASGSRDLCAHGLDPCCSSWHGIERQGGQLHIALVVRKAGVTGPT